MEAGKENGKKVDRTVERYYLMKGYNLLVLLFRKLKKLKKLDKRTKKC
jgi:hypothetical protein